MDAASAHPQVWEQLHLAALAGQHDLHDRALAYVRDVLLREADEAAAQEAQVERAQLELRLLCMACLAGPRVFGPPR